jgi:hypothetical protein
MYKGVSGWEKTNEIKKGKIIKSRGKQHLTGL